MGSDDYSSAAGGALRLKGAKIKKHKKKKEKSSLETALSTGDATSSRRSRSATPGENGNSSALDRRKESNDAPVKDRLTDGFEEDEETPRTKTATELRFEEARRKKLLRTADGASRPELFKTHKERVEELNTYLSKLSEHHDMPKIGPG